MRIEALIGLAIASLVLIGADSAQACPEGTVFSEYKGNAICAYSGQGATVAVRCTKMVNSCPKGTSYEQKRKGWGEPAYCCPKTIANEQSKECVWRGDAPLCGENRCGSLEQYKGSARDQESASFNAGTKRWENLFGKPCLSGSKALCCHYTG
jgi:hypothetical protein